MPRSPVVQGVIGGLSAAVGFEIGRLIVWLWKFLELPSPGRPRRLVRTVLFAAAGAILLFGLWHAAGWQNATRQVIGLALIDSAYPMTVLPVALAVFLVVWGLFRLLTLAVLGLYRVLHRWLPRKIGFAIGLVLVAWLTFAFTQGILGALVLRFVDSSFELADGFVDPENPGPAIALKDRQRRFAGQVA
jgi:uncharacterized membrane protein